MVGRDEAAEAAADEMILYWQCGRAVALVLQGGRMSALYEGDAGARACGVQPAVEEVQ